MPQNMTNLTQNVLIFIENTAISGDAMYGVYLNSTCYNFRTGEELPTYTDLSKVIKEISYFSPSFKNDLSLISSDPIAIHFCNKDGKPNFSSATFSISVYPGQLFQVPIVTVGDMRGLVSAPVLTTVERQCNAKLSSKLQLKQTTNSRECSDFQYSIFTNLTSNECVLSLSLIGSINVNRAKTTINASVLGCPEGFTLTGLYCDCDLRLKLTGAVCNITERSIVRRGTTWIGVSDNGSNLLVFSPVCPLGYCKNEEVKLLTGTR